MTTKGKAPVTGREDCLAGACNSTATRTANTICSAAGEIVDVPGTTARIKAVIVTLALWGLLPMKLAYWLINLGGLRND